MTTMRWKWGETNPRECRVEDAHVIAIGDLVYLDTDSIRPVVDLGAAASQTLAQQSVHDVFVGVAMQRHAVGDGILNIRVATSGVFEYVTASATYEMGALMACFANASDIPQNQQVAAVVGTNPEGESIGRCAKRTGGNVTAVLIDILSTIYHSGVQAAAT